MATASLININPQTELQFAVSGTDLGAAKKITELLQGNHEKNHIMFNNSGMHNHIAHHICTSFALGAAPETLEQNYEENRTYQRSLPSSDGELVASLHDPDIFMKNMYKPETYGSYLQFFTKEIQGKGYDRVVNDYVFANDRRATTMFNRLFAGFLHPLIHLGFAIEFKQPALVAEALAMTAIHSTWLDPFFVETDEAANASQVGPECLVNILTEIQKDPNVSTAAHWDDDNKIRDGVLARAKEQMISYAGRWQVRPDDIEEATAEMINACAYITGASQRPPKQIAFDFYFMHGLNASIFLSTFIAQAWIPPTTKAKLLTWKGRYDLLLYASRRSPPLLLEEISGYVPRNQRQSHWEAIFKRATVFSDDGHTAKMVRALKNGERVCEEWEGKRRWAVQGADWLKMANMVMDSRESGAKWVRSAGFDEAWEE
ncbi:MAG: hypothetical protein Q9219_003473 [cf. Caloplaca sp. 3 TL-2023]